jgi:hypothetical protein
MKLIFLDFDGVLNDAGTWARHQMAHGEKASFSFMTENVDPLHIPPLNEIIAKSGAKVVVSSVWRMGRQLVQLREILGRAGFEGHVIGKTPVLYDRSGDSVPRGKEIQAFLDDYNREEVTHFCIIDDDSDMAHLMDKLVQTSWDTGLNHTHVAPALKLLGVE